MTASVVDLAKAGAGISVQIQYGDDHACFYFPVDFENGDISDAISNAALGVHTEVARWLFENGLILTSDGKGVIHGTT